MHQSIKEMSLEILLRKEVFTPPECNPIELIFGKIKTRFYNLKYKYKDMELEDIITMAINSVTIDDVHNSINHVVNLF